MQLNDFQRSGNQAVDVEAYELENAAIDPSGTLWETLIRAAPWEGLTLLDLGCGSGFWLPKYSAASCVIGVEPDANLLEPARQRTGSACILQGSAEQIPMDDESVDVVHARFAYFFPSEGFDPSPGLAEVARVLRPGGVLVTVDNDHDEGELADLLRASPWAEGQGRDSYPTRWWNHHGAVTTPVMSSWQFNSRQDFERVLNMEFPTSLADEWFYKHPTSTGLSYGYLLHSWQKGH